MKSKQLPLVLAAFAALFLFVAGCNAPKKNEDATAEKAQPDMAQIKTEIQGRGSDWAAAVNARDANAIAAFYSDDAVSMADDYPPAVGNAAILESLQAFLAELPEGSTVSYDTQEVFGDEDLVTEIGRMTRKDASGKVFYTGKYMTIWEKQDGVYMCIRDIYNDDQK